MNTADYKAIAEDEWDFAACNNPECPQHPNNGGEPNKHYIMFNNGKHTYCEACLPKDCEAE